MKLLLRRIAVPLILTWTLFIGLFLAWHDSMTTDEGIHVASAYLAITRHEFRFDPEHPFLFKFATAIPILFLHPNAPTDDAELWSAGYPTTYDSWKEARSWSDRWFYASGNNAQLMIFLARIPGVLCLVGLCALIYYLGALWFSRRVGFYALLFTAFNPTILAHGHLTNTDVPVALAFLGVLWAMWQYFQRQTLKTTLILGLLLGIAETTKYSAVVLIPIVTLWVFYAGIVRKQFRQSFKHIAVIALTTLAIIWIVYFMPLYLVQGTAFQMKGVAELPPQLGIPGSIFNSFVAIRYVLPVDYVKGLSLVLGSSIHGRSTYLIGTAYGSGVWYYFPLLYLLKTQLMGLILLLIGCIALFKKPRTPITQWSPLTVMIVFVVSIFIIVSMINKLNIGIRHIIPLMPIASLAMALALVLLKKRYPTYSWLSPVVLSLYCLSPLVQFPNVLGYGNVFVYPSSKAYWYFNDSNIDWGQQSKAIADLNFWAFSSEPIYLNYHWNQYAVPYFGATVKSFDPAHLPPGGLVVVTATQLTWDDYAWFRNQTPLRAIGNHTFFYRIPCPSKDASEECRFMVE